MARTKSTLPAAGTILMLALVTGLGATVRAQGPASSSMTGYGISPNMSYGMGGTSYLPFNGVVGGYVPYTAGPGGGLGIMPRTGAQVMRGARATMSTGPAMGITLGQPRGAITPLAPVRVLSGGRGGMAGGTMIQRGAASGGGVNSMARPPVGSYPFRQPPSLTGPSGDAAASMPM